MEDLHDRVIRLRHVEPPEPAARSWWRIWKG
jgi:hypothetical protein